MSAAAALAPSGSVTDAPLFTLERACDAFFDLGDWLLGDEASRLPLDQVEREQELRGREAQRLLLQAHIRAASQDILRFLFEYSTRSPPGSVGPRLPSRPPRWTLAR